MLSVDGMRAADAKLPRVRRPLAIIVALLAAEPGCAARATMCTASYECGKSACVAGRCQVDKPALKPAVDSARRIVVHPVDLAFVQRGDDAHEAAPPVFAPLGQRDGRLLLRFSLALPPAATVSEAYIVLHRASAVDDDPAPISLHATRIVQDWQGGSVTYATQPRSRELRLPLTFVEPGGAPLVRVDVRDLVRQWPKRDPADQGVAIVAEGSTITGSTFALSEGAVEDRSGVDVGPYLEVYLR